MNHRSPQVSTGLRGLAWNRPRARSEGAWACPRCALPRSPARNPAAIMASLGQTSPIKPLDLQLQHTTRLKHVPKMFSEQTSQRCKNTLQADGQSAPWRLCSSNTPRPTICPPHTGTFEYGRLLRPDRLRCFLPVLHQGGLTGTSGPNDSASNQHRTMYTYIL